MLVTAALQLLLAVASSAPAKPLPYHPGGPFWGFCGVPGSACYTRIGDNKEEAKNETDALQAQNKLTVSGEAIPIAPSTLETFPKGSTSITIGPPVTAANSPTATAGEHPSATLSLLTHHTGETLPPGLRGGFP